MTSAKICLGFLVGLAIVGAMPTADATTRRAALAVTPASDSVTPTDFSASRRPHRMRHATRLHIHRRSDYSFFVPYAPLVPPFFPFGYHQGYF